MAYKYITFGFSLGLLGAVLVKVGIILRLFNVLTFETTVYTALIGLIVLFIGIVIAEVATHGLYKTYSKEDK